MFEDQFRVMYIYDHNLTESLSIRFSFESQFVWQTDDLVAMVHKPSVSTTNGATSRFDCWKMFTIFWSFSNYTSINSCSVLVAMCLKRQTFSAHFICHPFITLPDQQSNPRIAYVSWRVLHVVYFSVASSVTLEMII